jgi:hypothetical protein
LKKIFTGTVLAVFFFPFFVSAQAKKPGKILRSDFYVGEGWAELGADLGQAREQAKIRALGDLARNVRVSVRSALIDVLGQTAGQARQSIESKINTYAEIPSTRLDREDFFLNEPRRGQLTCRVGVNRARYDGEVRRDLLEKKNRALEEARLAHAALRDGRLADAWHALATLQLQAATDFPNLPLEGDADGDGKTEDVLLWARTCQRNIRTSLEISCSPGPFIFSQGGRFEGTPTARLTWIGRGPGHVEGLPLRAYWTHRPDSVIAQSLSDKGGLAPFRPSVDLFVESSWLRMELDGDDGGPEVACQSPFHRRRQAVLVVIADRKDVKEKILEESLARLRQFPWDVRTMEEEETPTGSESKISLTVHTAVVRHPEGNIYRATLSVNATILSGISGKEVFSGEGPTSVAFGATPADAVKRAIAALLPQTGPWLNEKVTGLP